MSGTDAGAPAAVGGGAASASTSLSVTINSPAITSPTTMTMDRLRRRTISRVEFMLNPVQVPAASEGTGLHSWNPDTVPTAPSIVVRSAPPPSVSDEAAGSGGNMYSSGGGGAAAQIGSPMSGFGEPISLSAHTDSGAGGDDRPRSPTSATRMFDSGAFVAFPATPAGTGVGERQFTTTTEPMEDMCNQQSPLLSVETGKRPSFVDGVGTVDTTTTLIGTAREDVFIDADPEPIMLHAALPIPATAAPPPAESAESPPEVPLALPPKQPRKKSSTSQRGGSTGSSGTAGGDRRPRSPQRPSPAAKGKRGSSTSPSTASRKSSGPPRRVSSASGSGAATAADKRDRRTVSPGDRKGSPSGGRRRSSARGASSGPSITEAALKSINYNSFSGSSLKPKARRAKMLSEFLGAHARGAAKIAGEWQTDFDLFSAQFVEESFEPHRREILRLSAYINTLRRDCSEKLDFAAAACNYTFDGVERLLEKLHASGLSVCLETGVVAFHDDVGHNSTRQSAFANATIAELNQLGPRGGAAQQPTPPQSRPGTGGGSGAADVRGHPVAEVSNADAAWRESDPHPPTQPTSSSALSQAQTIRDVFGATLGRLRAEALQLSLPPAISDAVYGDASLQEALEAAQRSYKAARARETFELKDRLQDLTDATADLLERLKEQDSRQKHRITGLQRVLDEGATRQKAADDVLTGSLAQGCADAEYAFGHVRALEAQLRARMAAVEAELHAALDNLIAGSAEVCLSSNAYGAGRRELLDSPSVVAHKKGTCVRGFTSTLERCAAEQADVLRDAQEAMMSCWKKVTVDTPGADEKATLLHRSFPAPFEARLNACDRATLLRLVHHVSLHSDDTTRRLISALQEHDRLLATNTPEALAVKEEEARHAAVRALLEKMYEEGDLPCWPHLAITGSGALVPDRSAAPAEGVTGSGERRAALSAIVADMAHRYTAMVRFEETYARALVRQREALEMELNPSWRPALFDPSVPVPVATPQRRHQQQQQQQSSSSSNGAAAATTSTPSHVSFGATFPTTATRSTTSPSGSGGNAHASPVGASWTSPTLPLLPAIRSSASSGGGSSSGAVPQRSFVVEEAPSVDGAETVPVSHAVAYLQRSNPSLAVRVVGASAVGVGRWGGRRRSTPPRSAGRQARRSGARLRTCGPTRTPRRQAPAAAPLRSLGCRTRSHSPRPRRRGCRSGSG